MNRPRLCDLTLRICSYALAFLSGHSTVRVEECMENLLFFERALGRAEHVTIGSAWLRDGGVYTGHSRKGVMGGARLVTDF